MALQTLLSEPPAGVALLTLLQELQNDKTTVAAGAAAAADIAIAGLGANDTIESVIEYAFTSADVTGVHDRTAHTTIPAAGKIHISDDTTGSTLIVRWADKP